MVSVSNIIWTQPWLLCYLTSPPIYNAEKTEFYFKQKKAIWLSQGHATPKWFSSHMLLLGNKSVKSFKILMWTLFGSFSKLKPKRTITCSIGDNINNNVLWCNWRDDFNTDRKHFSINFVRNTSEVMWPGVQLGFRSLKHHKTSTEPIQ